MTDSMSQTVLPIVSLAQSRHLNVAFHTTTGVDQTDDGPVIPTIARVNTVFADMQKAVYPSFDLREKRASCSPGVPTNKVNEKETTCCLIISNFHLIPMPSQVDANSPKRFFLLFNDHKIRHSKKGRTLQSIQEVED
uniref:Uncharacterized protein n=1 Tax=Panagrellus redivivus TaxID=6233 RepID=A0A7E4VYA0_PANRE